MNLRGIAMVLCALLAGCAAPGAVAPSAVVTSPRARVIAPAQMHGGVEIGHSSRAEVRAALGETLTIAFDSGYEIWLYRVDPEGAHAGTPARRLARWAAGAHARAGTGEFVILFAPTGRVAKTRFRAASDD